MNVGDVVNQRFEAHANRVERGGGATHEQTEVELLVSLAESSIGVLSLEGEAPNDLTENLVALAAMLSDRYEPHARAVTINTGATCVTVMGVPLSTRPVMVLCTHTSITTTLAGKSPRATDLIEDGYGPTPLAYIDCGRARHFYPALLKLVECAARAFVRADDWNWDEDGNEHWHPTELVRRVRRLRTRAKRLVAVGEVHDS